MDDSHIARSNIDKGKLGKGWMDDHQGGGPRVPGGSGRTYDLDDAIRSMKAMLDTELVSEAKP